MVWIEVGVDGFQEVTNLSFVEIALAVMGAAFRQEAKWGNSCGQEFAVESVQNESGQPKDCEENPEKTSELAIDDEAGKKHQSALQVLETVSKRATKGLPTAGIMSAPQLAERYLGNDKYTTNDERVDALVFFESLKNSVPGFITGLGGLITLPIAVPADLAGSWVLQARMVAAIAIIYDNDIEQETVWTAIFACMLGEQALNAFKDVAIELVLCLA